MSSGVNKVSWVSSNGSVRAIKGVQGFVSTKKFLSGGYSSSTNYDTIAGVYKRASEDVIADIVEQAKIAADSFISKYVDTLDGIPMYTGNLHDSIGVFVYKDEKLEKASDATEMATGPQRWGAMKAGPYEKDAGSGYGADFLFAERDASNPGTYGRVAVYLTAAIPYAVALEFGATKTKHWVGWFSALREKFVDHVKESIAEKVGRDFGGEVFTGGFESHGNVNYI